MSEIGRSCGAGTGCGGCRPEIASIVERETETQSQARFPLPVLQQAG